MLLEYAMLLTMGNSAKLSNGVIAQLERIFPEGWSARFHPSSVHPKFDGRLEVIPPRGRPSRFEVELKASFEPRDIDRTERLRKELPASEKALLVAPYLSPRSRQLLRERGISHADLTGNLRLSTDSLFIEQTGAVKAPKRDTEERARTSLRGPITGRVVRFLCDTRPPLKVREIAAATNVHPGNISRILEFLEREGYVERSGSGSLASVDWESLIQRWSLDLQKERRAQTFLEPRGIDTVTALLSEGTLPYAITGSYASAQLAPVIAPIAIDVYVRDIDEAREFMSLRVSDRIGNVRLVQAFDRVAFERTTRSGNVVLASPSQIAADLLTLPNRSSDEFAELISWMKRHESDWRS